MKPFKLTFYPGIFCLLFLGNIGFCQQQGIVTDEFIFEKAPFKSCHASTIAETPEGLVAAWFGGTEEKNPDVEIWLSRKVDGQWTVPVSVANGIQHDDKRYPCWNPVLFQVKGGTLMLFYKVGQDPSKWWGMLQKSNDGGKTWGSPCRLPEDVLGPVKNKPVMLANGTLFCPSSSEDHGWQVHFETTHDLGKTWDIIGPINSAKKYNVIQPSVLNYPDGRLQVLCRSKESVIVTSWFSDQGATWSPLESSGLPNPNSGTDAVTLADGRQLLVYNHTTKTPGKWGGSRTPLNVAVSQDGKKWFAALVLEHEPGEYSYPAVIQTNDGLVHITYTWKRERIKHVVVDPGKLSLKPIVNGQWPE